LCYNFKRYGKEGGKKSRHERSARLLASAAGARFQTAEKISPELKEAMKATREAMEALRLEEEKYGKIPRF